MCKHSPKSGVKRIDPCMRLLINFLNGEWKAEYYTIVACCCGHGKYPMTIVAKDEEGDCFELLSTKAIPRKKKFYKKDKKGFYYIPETIK